MLCGFGTFHFTHRLKVVMALYELDRLDFTALAKSDLFLAERYDITILTSALALNCDANPNDSGVCRPDQQAKRG